MKRTLLLGLFTFAFLILIYLLISMLPHHRTADSGNVTSWQWIREDSYLVDIELDADNGTVAILYSFCFTNPTESSYALAPISANFARIIDRRVISLGLSEQSCFTTAVVIHFLSSL